MEVIKKVEERRDFNEWLKSKYPLTDCSWEYDIYSTYPDTAKLALICEWIETKGFTVETQCDYKSMYVWDVYEIGDEINELIKECPCQYDTRNHALAKGIEEALKLIDKAQ